MKTTLIKNFTKYLSIIFGSAVFAAGFQFFLYPNSIVSGGISGIAMILNSVTGFPVGLTIIVFNIPLFAIAWRHFGLDFLIASLAGMLISSVFVDVFATFHIALTRDAMLAAVIGGVIRGAGLGIVYYVGGTTGGVDIVAKLLRQKYSQINFGTLLLILDTVIIVTYSLMLKNYESAMYSVIAMFAASKVVDLVLYGIDNSSLCYIISTKSDELCQQIISGSIKRGVTVLEGEGVYSHSKKHVIMCVVKRTQIGDLRRLIKNVDIDAFFIVSDVKNVFGKGFESISEIK